MPETNGWEWHVVSGWEPTGGTHEVIDDSRLTDDQLSDFYSFVVSFTDGDETKYFTIHGADSWDVLEDLVEDMVNDEEYF